MLADAGSGAIATVSCGLDLDRWQPYEEMPSCELLVGFPLRDEPHKGTNDAFAAAELVRRQIPDARFATFGEATEVTPPPFVERRGRLSPASLCDFYNECAVFLLPSHYEGWGLPAAEAMACGTAVVTTANGGTEDFAEHETTALVVPPAEPPAMAAAVSRLLLDPVLRAALANGGHRRVSQMSWEAATDALVAVLKS